MSRTVIAAVVLACLTTGAHAQNKFPTKPVRVIVTEAGGTADFYARTIAHGLTSRWGLPVVVENRPSIVAIDSLIRALPDGYTVLCYASGLWIGPLMQKATYDPLKDLVPITIAVSAPNVLAVNPAVPAKSVKELIALAKAKPGALNYGSGGAGSVAHLAAELFNSMAGVSIVRVPFKGAAPATNAVITGDVHMIFTTVGGLGPHIKAGRVRALAVTSAKPTQLLPDLPTIATVLPGYESTYFQGVFAPVKTPPAVVAKIQQDIAAVLAQQDVKDLLLAASSEPVGSTSEALAQAMRSDMAKYGKILKSGGIKQE